jgi:hypothetical protein
MCSEADRKLDIFLASADAAFQDSEPDWPNVPVIGKHKRNPDKDRLIATLVQLAGYVGEVFRINRIDNLYLVFQFAEALCGSGVQQI